MPSLLAQISNLKNVLFNCKQKNEISLQLSDEVSLSDG